MDRFIKENAIDQQNPMTREQANRLVDEVNGSRDPRIRGFLQSLDSYIESRPRPGSRIPGLRGGGRGRE